LPPPSPLPGIGSSVKRTSFIDFEAPLPRLRQWIAEKLHEMSPIFTTPQLAITKILDFAEVLNIPKAGRLVMPVLRDDGTLKYKDGDNNCTLCKTWCCMNNPNGDPKLCVLFNKNLKIDTFPAQQQRFIRGGRKYLEENPGTNGLSGRPSRMAPESRSTSRRTSRQR
jgi:hypothetical protein